MIRCLRMRPPLRLECPLPPEAVLERLREAVARPGANLTATFSDRYVVLRIPEAQQHFFSPQLSFEVEPREEGSVITGLFMPMPAVWTGFMALYAIIVFGGFIGAVYGWSQAQLDSAPHALWSVPAALVLLALVYLAACIGQHLGEKQMIELRTFVEGALRPR